VHWYRGRIEPEPFHIGKVGERAPKNVSHISGNCIVLDHENDDGVYEEAERIQFSNEGCLWENDDLFAKLADLNALGMPFQYQPQDMGSPEALMVWWQDTGKLKTSFNLISWYHYHRWRIHILDLPQIGVESWTGPKPFGH
jgi:hypothetical protein